MALASRLSNGTVFCRRLDALDENSAKSFAARVCPGDAERATLRRPTGRRL